MKIFKSPIFTFIIGVIITGSIGVVASGIFANQVTYDNTTSGLKDSNNQNVTTVQGAIDVLYGMANKTPTQVATLTTQGATYTMQNDGYIVGTAQSSNHACNAVIFINNISFFQSPWDQDYANQTSIYVQKGEEIGTRNDCGTYNLTVYEWK